MSQFIISRVVEFNQNMKRNIQYQAFLLVFLNTFLLLKFDCVEARDKGDDIIMTKGKLIMRGGKGKGKLSSYS